VVAVVAEVVVAAAVAAIPAVAAVPAAVPAAQVLTVLPNFRLGEVLGK
jgi:hypothetical protein